MLFTMWSSKGSDIAKGIVIARTFDIPSLYERSL